eukprot:gb/GECG01002406.1/.p1 GENE.gb/GECG01002406.1/~~gb/GECG01002406.1/.p1  ORF type:complete len:181 (+),score=15.96 gb/GECG01002406.1/:1-543(+)
MRGPMKKNRKHSPLEENIRQFHERNQGTPLLKKFNWDRRFDVWCYYDYEKKGYTGTHKAEILSGLYVRSASFGEWDMLFRWKPDIEAMLGCPLRESLLSVPVACVRWEDLSLYSEARWLLQPELRTVCGGAKFGHSTCAFEPGTEFIVAVPFTGDALVPGLRMYVSFRHSGLLLPQFSAS